MNEQNSNINYENTNNESNPIILRTLSDRQKIVIETMTMRLSTTEALIYLHEHGFPIKEATYYREKSKLENMKMERLNGEIRDREKTMRGLKKTNTSILKGYQIYHNYLREQEALNGQTPADKCGINIEGQNKWITIIQNSSAIS